MDPINLIIVVLVAILCIVLLVTFLYCIFKGLLCAVSCWQDKKSQRHQDTEASVERLSSTNSTKRLLQSDSTEDTTTDNNEDSDVIDGTVPTGTGPPPYAPVRPYSGDRMGGNYQSPTAPSYDYSHDTLTKQTLKHLYYQPDNYGLFPAQELMLHPSYYSVASQSGSLSPLLFIAKVSSGGPMSRRNYF